MSIHELTIPITRCFTNDQTITNLNTELEAISVSGKALCKDIEAGDTRHLP